MDHRDLHVDRPLCFQIRVRGRLDMRWSDWFDGMAVTYDADDTLLTGPLADQAALYGVLHRIRNLGLTLLALAPLPDHQAPAPPNVQSRV